VRPFRSGKFLAYSASNSDHGISWAIFTQRLRSDSFPHEGSSKSEGEGVASSAFLYMIAGGDARVLTYFTCLSCTLFSVARSKPRLRQVRSIYSASPKYYSIREMVGSIIDSSSLKIPDNILLIFQIPSSPELNLIERVWHYVKQELSWEIYDNLDTLKEKVCIDKKYFLLLTRASISGWDYILSAWDTVA